MDTAHCFVTTIYNIKAKQFFMQLFSFRNFYSVQNPCFGVKFRSSLGSSGLVVSYLLATRLSTTGCNARLAFSRGTERETGETEGSERRKFGWIRLELRQENAENEHSLRFIYYILRCL